MFLEIQSDGKQVMPHKNQTDVSVQVMFLKNQSDVFCTGKYSQKSKDVFLKI